MAFFTIGKIIKPFGVLGEVKVDFFVNEMDDLQAFSAFYIEDKRSPNGRKEIRFENLREGGDRMIARIDAIPDRNAAELFRDRDILVDEAELPETQADEFYIRDLLDANVFFEGAPYGTVMNVFGIGNRTFLLVKNSAGKEIALPFEDEYLDEVDTKTKEIRIKSIEGLF